ncbi:amidohydrolase [Pseudogracilibacillus auburnensis]|uniref:amidohydrolase n=1 Tax=Pseudogracilibacillus auburnensis TaxID=1494959 RepID=UPI001A95A6F7|nr:amidohydrolase [Pseudogracilibacillus auburnensis]MBO1004494.1 amidohydrolase [Pseudogracilibacillus auburnensis]
MSHLISTKAFESTYEQMINWRRYIHQYPELSFKEYKTAEYISDQLNELGNIEVSHPTKTSVMGRLKGGKGSGKTIAIRADIDALPIKEETNLPFASKVDGVMHACGHDGHAAILLGTAKVLSELQEELRGEFVFLFQHAEEVPPGGAKEMVEAGVLDGVDSILGLHLWSTVPLGEIQITEGPISAASDIFDITIEGKSGHASQPEAAVDALSIGSQIITNLQHITSRVIGPLDSGVVSVTRFHSGDAYNVIPDKAYLGGSVRALTNDIRERMKQNIEQICTNVATAHHAKATLSYEYGYDPVINDKELTESIFENAQHQFKDDERIKVIQSLPMLGGEDFSAFSNVVPGCYVGIGAMKSKNGIVFPHHHPQFDISEEALLIALKYYVLTALHVTGNARK